MIEVAITTLLEATAGVGERIYPSSGSVAVDTDLPRILWTLLDEERRYSDDGNDRLTLATFQLDVFAELPETCRNIFASITADADASPPGLDGYSGTVDDTEIVRVYFRGVRSAQGGKIEGKDQTYHRYLCEMFVEYRG